MDIVLLGIGLTVAVVALILSGLSLVLHWVRRNETVEYTDLSKRIVNLDLALIEAVDKFKHFVNRQTQRRAREAADEAREEEPPSIDPKERLRQKLRRRNFSQAQNARLE